jgi:hypothetical protein
MPPLLTAIRDHLVTNAVVRAPDVPGALPPCWKEPKLGTPAPGETPPGGGATEVGVDAVVALYLTGGIAPEPYGSFIRKPIVDVRLRTRTGLIAENLELAITKVLIDRRDFTMGGLYVVECEQWRTLQRLGSDEQGFEYTAAFVFELYRP